MSSTEAEPIPAEAFNRVVVLGLMGVGKTTVGRIVASELGWPLSDSDAWVQAREGASVRELSRRIGAEAMHAIEAEHLLSALEGGEPLVVAAAASVVERERCRRALRRPGVLAVWLNAPPSTLAPRLACGSWRPDFGSDAQTLLSEQLARRERLFRSVARLIVPVADLGPEAAAGEILSAVRAGGDRR
jgi:shikimate kinase